MSKPTKSRSSTLWVAGLLLLIPGAILVWLLLKPDAERPSFQSDSALSDEGAPPDERKGGKRSDSQATSTTSPAPGFSAESAEREHFKQLERLMVSDKQQALKWIEDAEPSLPKSGRFAEARKASQITLLVDLGRMKEARDLTYLFIAQYPSSEYRRLVQGKTGIHPRPGAPPGFEN